MANYVFEQMTQEQAAGFTGADFLIFTTATTNAVNISVTPAAAAGLNAASITLVAAGKSLTFPAGAISTASQAQHIVFNDQSSLLLGGEGTANDTITGQGTVNGVAVQDVIYGFAGNDTLGLDGAAGAGNDYLYGGSGADTLFGGDGNDHIYGNALTATQGATDGADSIIAGAGNDYVNGNAGADFINGGDGADRLFGGGDADTILGGAGSDTVNGNQGNDNIQGEAGNDILRGGQGADTIQGGADNDIIYGDVGADSIVGGAGFDVLFGGTGTAGADTANSNTFVFGATDATTANIGQTGALANVVDIIGDYNDGVDKIDFVNAITAVTLDSATTPSTFGSLQAALTFAQQLADNSATANSAEVVALNFNGNAYLFTTSSSGVGAAIDTVVQLSGVTASTIDTTDFI